MKETKRDEILAILKDLAPFFDSPLFSKPVCEIKEGEFMDYKLACMGKLVHLIPPRRLTHSMSVGMLCMKTVLANKDRYALNTYVAYFAGLLHDCGKGIKEEKAIKILKLYHPDYVNHPEWTYHQFVGRLIAEYLFGVSDSDLLEAIEFHATGKREMSLYQRIVYACDKIDPYRGYDSKYMIDAMNEDIEKGFVLVLGENLKYYKEKGFEVDDSLAKECFGYYLGD